MTTKATVTGINTPKGPLAGGTAVKITGTNLTGAGAVFFGGRAVNATNVTATSVDAVTPAGAAAGKVDVTVNVPTGTTPANPKVTFTYDAPAVPTIKTMSVTTGPQAGGTPVTLSGSDLAGATAVHFGAVGATFTATAAAITLKSPAQTAAGTVAVTVDFPTGPVSAGSFDYVGPSITPTNLGSGSFAGGTPVTIKGTHLSTAKAVNFGAVGAKIVSISDTAIAVTAPEQKAAGKVDVTVNFPTGNVAAGTFDYVVPVPVNATFVIRNQTGVPDELVFVKFLGAQINANQVAQTYGSGTALANGANTSSKSYSLLEMTAPLAGAPASAAPVPQFAVNDYAGGRIYFSLGVPLVTVTTPAAHNSNDKDFYKVYGFIEPSVFPNTIKGNTNLDASYVDFIGIPVDIAIRNCADNSLVIPPDNNPQTTPPGTKVFTTLTADANIPKGTLVAASTSAKTKAGKTKPSQTVTIGGTARIISPSIYVPSLIANAKPYHDWTGPGSLIAALTKSGASMPVASYQTTDKGVDVPYGTLFGFTGSKKSSSITKLWTVEQSYDTQAVALADLNPKGANKRIPTLAGVPGIKISGSGKVVGQFDIYLTNSDLEAPSGIYGANPPYVVDWIDATKGAGHKSDKPVAYAIAQIENDLAGRVVGDLLAGFNFGWAACATTVAAQASANGLAGSLKGSVFDVTSGSLANTAIANLTTGQLFYLLSLQETTVDLSKWFGAAIQPHNPNYYNNYSSDFQALTTCYNMAFTDRLQGPSDPDIFFPPSDQTYVEVTLLPGAYTVKVTG